jgi:hypothetical protein
MLWATGAAGFAATRVTIRCNEVLEMDMAFRPRPVASHRGNRIHQRSRAAALHVSTNAERALTRQDGISGRLQSIVIVRDSTHDLRDGPECSPSDRFLWQELAVRRLRRDDRYLRSFHVMRFLLLRADRAYAERYIAWCTAAPRLKLPPQRDPELSLSTFSRVRIPPALLLDSTNQWPHRLRFR